MPYQRCRPAAVLCIVPTRRSFVQDSGVGRVCAEAALLCRKVDAVHSLKGVIFLFYF